MQERFFLRESARLPNPVLRFRFVPGALERLATSTWRQAVHVGNRAADERLLAFARMFGAAVMILATAINQQYSTMAYVLVGAYGVHASVVSVLGSTRSGWLLRHVGVLHAIDMGWAISITALTGGPGGNAFAIFVFPLLASMFRWGLYGGIRDGAIILFSVVAHWAVPAFGFAAARPFALELVIIRVAYIGIGISLLFAVVLQRQYVLSQHALVLADLMARVSHASKLDSAIKDVLRQVLAVFEARHALLVIEELEGGTVQRWRADVRQGGTARLTYAPIPREERADWMLRAADGIGACELQRSSASGMRAVVTATLDGDHDASRISVPVPPVIADASAWKTLLLVPVATAGIWRGQLYILDSTRRHPAELRLRILQAIAQQVGPALVNLYLLRRLRSRAESIERGRISRELHDGALPALVGLEMRIEALCRSAAPTAPGFAADLAEIRHRLHGEAVNLRMLMQRLRSNDVDARQLPGELADRVTRFRRATGVDASFAWTAEDLQLSPRQCSEIVRIVQEALFNVRRHAAATKVVVRVEGDACSWIVVVADNGRGLGFTGRLSDEELKASRLGPRVIHDRVAALGGTLDVESSDDGTRLEMTFARELVGG